MFTAQVLRNSLFQTHFCPEETFDNPEWAWYISACKKQLIPCVYSTLRLLFLSLMNQARLSIGRYLPIGSPLHRLDARTKIVCTTGLIVTLFLQGTPTGWMASLVGLVVVSRMTGLPFSFFWGNLKSLSPIIILTLGLNAWLMPGTPVHPDAAFTIEGIQRGGLLCLRLVVIVWATTLLTLTTSPMALADGLRWLLHPLTWIRIPVAELALTASIALRLIPLLTDEATRIQTAQKSRGADVTGSLARRIRSLGSILIPLFVSAFGRAEKLADAMELRGYSGSQARTQLREPKLSGADALTLGICLAFVLTVAVKF